MKITLHMPLIIAFSFCSNLSAVPRGPMHMPDTHFSPAPPQMTSPTAPPASSDASGLNVSALNTTQILSLPQDYFTSLTNDQITHIESSLNPDQRNAFKTALRAARSTTVYIRS